MDEIARNLRDGIDAAIAPWVVRSVSALVEAWTGAAPSADVLERAAKAGEEARADIVPRLSDLLAADVDEQWTTPLAIVRGAVRYPAGVLRELGVPPVERDSFAEQRFPDDDYGLTPATFADLDPDLAEAGLVWGAAKAWEHRRRHTS